MNGILLKNEKIEVKLFSLQKLPLKKKLIPDYLFNWIKK